MTGISLSGVHKTFGTGRHAGFGFRCPGLGPQGRSEAGSEGRRQAGLKPPRRGS